ncbi:hypothetical protein [Deinococcus sp.]|uniref:hypothetical protein n=1 Tax=Deinococcus sp. TaxID=47478 RepID=UPI003C7B14EC
MSTALAQTAPAQTAAAQPAPASKNMRINVYFEKVDANGLVILKYGTVSLTTRLSGIKLRDGSAGVLSLVIPTSVLLQAEVISKGTVPVVVLWKGTKNLNEELLIQGVAEGVRH